MIIGILIVGAIAVYIAACVLTGLAPTNTRLAGFTPQIGPINREYAQPADAVLRSYAEAARSISAVQQAVASAIQESEGVAARL